ncbi:MAG: hypothetical protein IKF71_02575 [Bacilli bacterium]|nr:hypothetical protein [Bacilli bacterium]
MASLEKDIAYLDAIFRSDENLGTFSYIYPNSNENISSIFEKISLKDKKVLSVLSSSDFLFSALVDDAKEVDTFDINPITYRYFYLRKWLLEYKALNAYWLSKQRITDIIKSKEKSEDQDERESSLFWQEYLKHVKGDFYDTNVFACAMFTPQVPYSKQYGKLRSILMDKKIDFEHTDIAKEGIHMGEKYDSIYLSNILDYQRSPQRLERILPILNGLLEENGEIICTSIFGVSSLYGLEIPYFSKDFDYSKIGTEPTGIKSYVYKRRS